MGDFADFKASAKNRQRTTLLEPVHIESCLAQLRNCMTHVSDLRDLNFVVDFTLVKYSICLIK